MSDEQAMGVLALGSEQGHRPWLAVGRIGPLLRSMLRHQERVSVAAVAKQAGVSRNFVCAHEDLLRRVEEAAVSHSHRISQPRAKPSSEASLRNRLADALDARREANEENKPLRAQIKRLTGELARDIANRPARRQSR